jgi:hypothetical protein
MSKTFNKFVSANKNKIKEAYKDCEGYYVVVMAGYCDDMDKGRHTVIDTNSGEVMRRIRAATVCDCAECK